MRQVPILLLIAVSLTSHADMIVLSNGDRLSGEVVTMGQGVLQFRASFGQELRLPWDRVERLSTDEPVRVVLTDDTWLHGQLRSAAPGRVELYEADDHEDVQFELAAVGAINPGSGPDAPPVTTQGRLNFGASKTQGNTRTESFRGDGEFVARTALNRYTLGGEANYGRNEGERNKNDARAFARYDHFIGDRWYVNSNLSLAHDEFKDLTLRSTLGLGIGYQWLDSERQSLSIESGVTYVHENFDEAPDSSGPAARLAIDYEHRFNEAGMAIFHRNESLLGLDDVSDLLFRSRTGIQVPLLERITGTAQLSLDYDHAPPPGNRSTDIVYLLTLGYAW